MDYLDHRRISGTMLPGVLIFIRVTCLRLGSWTDTWYPKSGCVIWVGVGFFLCLRLIIREPALIRQNVQIILGPLTQAGWDGRVGCFSFGRDKWDDVSQDSDIYSSNVSLPE